MLRGFGDGCSSTYVVYLLHVLLDLLAELLLEAGQC